MRKGISPYRLLVVIVGMTMADVLLVGCASPGSPSSPSWPWSSHSAAKAASPAPEASAKTAPAKPDPQALKEVMAELQQLGTLDRAAQQQVMDDLKKCDPSLWPLMLQQVRATAAYRRQLDEREKAPAEQKTAATVAAGGPTTPAGPPAAAAPLQLEAAAPVQLAILPAPPQKSPPAATPAAPASSASGNVPGKAADGVVQASYHANMPLDWEAHMAAAIAELEAQSKGTPKTDTEVAQRAYLQMLYLLAGRRDEALAPIPGAPAAIQDFWSKQLYGLATWLDTDHTPDSTRRAAEAKRIFSEAMLRLGETAPLVVHNMAFCTEIQSFGSITPFKKAEFTPNQELLLYAEVENFTVQPTARGFHTALRSSFQIFDSRGQRIDDHEFPTTEEYCQSQRRDFFIGYHLRLPKRIYNGKHTLQLTIEDLQSHKVGQSSIDLVVKGAEE